MRLKEIAENILERKLQASEGLDYQLIQQVESKLGMRLPEVLRDFYAMVGNLPLFVDGHYHFRNIKDLKIKDQKLVFLGENQEVIHWGVDVSDTNTVYQTTQPIEGGQAIWHQESTDLDKFMEMMLYVQCVQADEALHHKIEGGYTYFGYLKVANEDDDTRALLLANLERYWQNVARGDGVRVFSRLKSILLHFVDRGGNLDLTSTMHLCTKDERLLDAWIDLYGFNEL